LLEPPVAHILVVDDDGAIRSVVRFTLEMAGHDVMVAGEGEAALEAMKTRTPDGIVLDLMMPRLDGLGFLDRLAEQSDAVPPVLVLTARIELAEDVRVLGHRVLEKPFSPRALNLTIAEMLGESQQGHRAAG
jgi:DNA-binding response OmpR family regulator